MAEKIRGQRSEDRSRMPEARGQKSEARSQKSEVGGQRSEAGSQTSEVRDQRTDAGDLSTRNWFAMVSLEAPHPPYNAPAAGVTPPDPSEIVLSPNVPRGSEVEARARRELAGYYAHLEATDRAIGRLLAAVPRETAVVFTSVHGDMHGAHGLFRKGWPYEESVRVPLLVRWPESEKCGMQNAESRMRKPEARDQRSEVGGQKPEAGGQRSEIRRQAGETNEAAISLADLPALMLAKIQNPNFKFQNQWARISMPSVVRLPDQCDRIWRGVRTPRRKLVLNADGSPWLLFDLEKDPLEQRNLTQEAAWAAEISDLRARLD